MIVSDVLVGSNEHSVTAKMIWSGLNCGSSRGKFCVGPSRSATTSNRSGIVGLGSAGLDCVRARFGMGIGSEQSISDSQVLGRLVAVPLIKALAFTTHSRNRSEGASISARSRSFGSLGPGGSKFERLALGTLLQKAGQSLSETSPKPPGLNKDVRLRLLKTRNGPVVWSKARLADF